MKRTLFDLHVWKFRKRKRVSQKSQHQVEGEIMRISKFNIARPDVLSSHVSLTQIHGENGPLCCFSRATGCDDRGRADKGQVLRNTGTWQRDPGHDRIVWLTVTDSRTKRLAAEPRQSELTRATVEPVCM